MPLPREHLLDELATAYVQAIAAVGGATIAISRRDYGVDGTLKQILRALGDRFIESGFPVEFQLKGTTAAIIDETHVRFDLKVRNYDLIVTREPMAIPYYLFLVCFDPSTDAWIAERPQDLILSASAYWWTDSRVPAENQSTIRIAIPVTQRLTSASIESMLNASKDKFGP